MIYHLSFLSPIVMGISYTVSFVRWGYTFMINSSYNILYTHEKSLPRHLCDAKLNRKWFYWTIFIILDPRYLNKLFFTILLTLLSNVMKYSKSARIANQSLLETKAAVGNLEKLQRRTRFHSLSGPSIYIQSRTFTADYLWFVLEPHQGDS